MLCAPALGVKKTWVMTLMEPLAGTYELGVVFSSAQALLCSQLYLHQEETHLQMYTQDITAHSPTLTIALVITFAVPRALILAMIQSRITV